MKKINKTEAIISSFKGEIQVDYDTLVAVFGEPHYIHKNNMSKVDVEWGFDFDGVVAIIYNWKNGKNYLGVDGLELKDIEKWNVGGSDDKAVEVVEKEIYAYVMKNRY